VVILESDVVAHTESTLARVQRESGEWRQAAYPDTATGPLQTLGMNEEISEIVTALLETIGMAHSMGSVTHAVLKNAQQIRGYDATKTREEVADGLADVMIFACGVADAYGINLDATLARVWNHVRDRNIVQGSMNNGNEPPTDGESGHWVDGTDTAGLGV
jgi:NTP pyrophosphatase (non-canonical NTP hydrolase)